jgi:protocatechuate 3,4-dioxygenase beta subunit
MQHDPHPTSPVAASGLASDLDVAGSQVLGRRRLLGMFGAAVGAVLVSACADESSSSGSAAGSSPGSTAGTSAPATTASPTTASPTAPAVDGASAATTDATAATAPTPVDVDPMPGETAGPFAADGSNDNGAGGEANVLVMPGVIRNDIRTDIGGGNEQPGTPMSLEVTVIDTSTGLPKPGAAVYVWHCNQAGGYSSYNSSMLGGDFSDVSWLRGVQVADANGELAFTTILPGRYPGRAAHIHFAVYEDQTFADELLISQMAFDDEGVDALYAAAGYSDALDADTDNDDDGVFRDGWALQTLAITGDVTTGLTASIVVGV